MTKIQTGTFVGIDYDNEQSEYTVWDTNYRAVRIDQKEMKFDDFEAAKSEATMRAVRLECDIRWFKTETTEIDEDAFYDFIGGKS